MGVLINEKEEAQVVPELRRQERFSFRKCCCGCSLQTGAIVIGTFGLMNGLTSILLALYGFGHLNQKQVETSVGEYGTLLYQLMEDGQNALTNAVMIFYGLLHVITAFSLIYGSDKRRPSLIKFWLFTRYVEFVMSIIGSVFIISTLLIQHAPTGAIFTSAFSFLVCIGILAYCIGVVRSFLVEVVFENMSPVKQVI